MVMTVLVTRNVEQRVRGFLGSCMLEIAAGVYTSTAMNPSVRDRVWAVLEKWKVGSRSDSAVMTWPDRNDPGGQAVRLLGEPPLELRSTDGVVLASRGLSDDDHRSLTIQLEDAPF